jgi:hypothetical protein
MHFRFGHPDPGVPFDEFGDPAELPHADARS